MPELDPQARKSWDCFVDLHDPGWGGGDLDYPTTRAVADYLTALESERATLHARAEAAERRVALLEEALRPFADAIRDDNEIVPGHWDLNAHTGLKIAHLRQARAALAAPAPGATPAAKEAGATIAPAGG